MVVLLTGLRGGRHARRPGVPRRATTPRGWLFLNFDNVGGPGTLRYLTREGVISHWDADPGLVAAAAAVADAVPDLRMAPEELPAGLTYDASPVLARGGRALTLSVQDGFDPEPAPADATASRTSTRTGSGGRSTAGVEMVAAIDAARPTEPRRPAPRIGSSHERGDRPGREVRRRIRRLTLLGSPSDQTVMRAVRWLTAAAIAVANLAGTAIVFVLLVWVLPPDGDDGGSSSST